jgi:hypothetical protein
MVSIGVKPSVERAIVIAAGGPSPPAVAAVAHAGWAWTWGPCRPRSSDSSRVRNLGRYCASSGSRMSEVAAAAAATHSIFNHARKSVKVINRAMATRMMSGSLVELAIHVQKLVDAWVCVGAWVPVWIGT